MRKKTTLRLLAGSPMLLLLLLFPLVSCATTDQSAGPPDAPARPVEVHVHGQVLIDDYAWIREKDNPEVIAYLEAENAWADAVMDQLEQLQQTLYDEMLGRIMEDDADIPSPRYGYLYYTRTEEGKPYELHCRRKAETGSPEEILLDANQEAGELDYYSIESFEPSPDGTKLAWLVDASGYEHCDLFVKDLATGEIIDSGIKDLDPWSLAWANDNQTIFYARQDDTNRGDRIYRHRIGTPMEEDVLVYHDPDGLFYVDISRSRSGNWLIAGSGGQITSEYHLLDADDPEGDFRVIIPRQRGVEYQVEHSDDRFFLRTNQDAPNFKIMMHSTDLDDGTEWVDFLPHDPDRYVVGVDAFQNHLVVTDRVDGYQGIGVIDLRSGEHRPLPMPERVSTAGPATNHDFDTRRFRYDYTSLVTPETLIETDLETGDTQRLKTRPVLGDYDPDDYVTLRLEATGHDGVRIPVSLIHRKGVRPDGSNPLYLTGYGSYGSSYDPYFSSSRLSLLDRGVVYAIAHVRGGGELGRAWYEDGKFLKKKNTFLDFIACAEMLRDTGWAAPDRIAIEGGSAGGLLIGAVLNMRPDLFAVAIADVPFVDVVNTMLDASIPLTVGEYEEWGNPEDPEYFDYMRSYSPYDNVRDGNYPHLLVAAGLNDPRVHYWEPAKWVARMRDHDTGEKLLLLKTNMGAGHGGSSDRYDRLKEIAFAYAFVLDGLGAVAPVTADD
jgi:oligopeptidase B